MSAPRSFQMAAKSSAKPENEYEPRTYRFVSAVDFVPDPENEGEEIPVETVVTANYPGDGVLTLLFAANAPDADTSELIGVVLNTLKTMFSREDYRFLRKRLADEQVDIGTLMALISDAMEAWTAFPTQPQSDSQPSRRSTGTRSTGRAPGKGSTLPASAPVDS